MQVHDNLLVDRDVHPSPLSDKEHLEKAKRCEFVQGLLLSIIFDGGLWTRQHRIDGPLRHILSNVPSSMFSCVEHVDTLIEKARIDSGM